MAARARGLKPIPSFIYGTAWKTSQSQELVKQAILTGFLAVDTAAQPKHYREELVGAGIREALAASNLTRDQLWIQTKFTPVAGQDPDRMPYDPADSISEQVKASLASSFHNLRNSDSGDDYLDAVLLHSPYAELEQTVTAWQTLSAYLPDKIRTLGVSNISLPELRSLYEAVESPPSIVQNSFHAGTGYDARLRDFCREKGIIYQSFWTLTANSHLLHGGTVAELASKVRIKPEGALYGLVALGLDIRVLNGTTNQARMEQDLSDLGEIKIWRQNHRNEWMTLVSRFKGSLSRGRIL